MTVTKERIEEIRNTYSDDYEVVNSQKQILLAHIDSQDAALREAVGLLRDLVNEWSIGAGTDDCDCPNCASKRFLSRPDIQALDKSKEVPDGK